MLTPFSHLFPKRHGHSFNDRDKATGGRLRRLSSIYDGHEFPGKGQLSPASEACLGPRPLPRHVWGRWLHFSRDHPVLPKHLIRGKSSELASPR